MNRIALLLYMKLYLKSDHLINLKRILSHKPVLGKDIYKSAEYWVRTPTARMGMCNIGTLY